MGALREALRSSKGGLKTLATEFCFICYYLRLRVFLSDVLLIVMFYFVSLVLIGWLFCWLVG